MRALDAPLHQRLERAGFRLDFGPDLTGVFSKSLREGGGFYVDVGCSELIADGKVALRSGVRVVRLERGAVVLAPLGPAPSSEPSQGFFQAAAPSEERIAADVLIYATGFSSMHNFVADIVGEAAAERVGKVWGYGSGTRKDPGPWEGELRNMWKPTPVNGLWFQGGNLAQSRHYSRILALQLQARWLGLSTPVYRQPTPRAD